MKTKQCPYKTLHAKVIGCTGLRSNGSKISDALVKILMQPSLLEREFVPEFAKLILFPYPITSVELMLAISAISNV